MTDEWDRQSPPVSWAVSRGYTKCLALTAVAMYLCP